MLGTVLVVSDVSATGSRYLSNPGASRLCEATSSGSAGASAPLTRSDFGRDEEAFTGSV